MAQQKRDLNLAIVLICTILMFLATHTPRIMAGIFEAVTINAVLNCQEKGRGYLEIWYLYLLTIVNLLQVINNLFINKLVRFLGYELFSKSPHLLLCWIYLQDDPFEVCGEIMAQEPGYPGYLQLVKSALSLET